MALQATAIAETAPQRLVYDGRLGELYGIFFLNLLLGIITLGIYRFWGRTRYRRYLWSHTSYDGDRFEYTGTGGELFRGFLIAMAFFVLLMAVVFGAQAILGQEHPILFAVIVVPVYLVLIVLFFAARYTALRYRLTRTLWRGIRGGLAGSAINFSLRSIGYGILSGLTLYQFVPFATVRLWRYRLKNLFFGTAQAGFEGRGRDLYGRYLGSFLGWLGSGIVIAILLFAAVGSDIMGLAQEMGEMQAQSQLGGSTASEQSGPPQMPPEMLATIQRLVWAAAVAYLAWLLLGAIAFLWYWAFSVRYITAGASLAGLKFESTVTAGRLFGLLIGNLLLMIVTFGFGYPIVLQRIWRFGAENFLIHGRVDGAVIEQSRLLPPRMGEGWLEVLDPGIV